MLIMCFRKASIFMGSFCSSSCEGEGGSKRGREGECEIWAISLSISFRKAPIFLGSFCSSSCEAAGGRKGGRKGGRINDIDERREGGRREMREGRRAYRQGLCLLHGLGEHGGLGHLLHLALEGGVGHLEKKTEGGRKGGRVGEGERRRHESEWEYIRQTRLTQEAQTKRRKGGREGGGEEEIWTHPHPHTHEQMREGGMGRTSASTSLATAGFFNMPIACINPAGS